MAVLRVLLGLIALAAAVAGVTYAVGAWDEDDVREARDRASARVLALGGGDGTLDGELANNACEELAARVDAIAAQVDRPAQLLRRLGRDAAGIREAPRALLDLARGGRNVIPGRGFRDSYDDGTAGQVRHFAGIAVAASYGGAQATRLISIFARRDPLESPDGRLTERGIEFAGALARGKLELDRAGEWILERLCASP